MNTNRFNWRESAGIIVLGCLVVLIAQAGLLAQSTTAPAENAPTAILPTTQPVATTAGSAQEDLSYRMPQVIHDALKFSAKESLILRDTAVEGLTPPTSDVGLPILLSHIFTGNAKIPQLDAPEFQLLEQPPVRILREHGQKEFSLRPIRLEVRVFTVRKFKPASSSYWPKDRYVWELACLSASTPDPDHNPVIVIVADDPTKDFGKPDKVVSNGGVEILQYDKSPRRMEIAGIFYRNLHTPDMIGKIVVAPIVIAWQNASPHVEEAIVPGIVAAQPDTTPSGPPHEDLYYRMPEVIDKAMQFSKDEKLILNDTAVEDSTPPPSDKGLPILLSHVAKIPQLGGPEFDLLESPPVRILRDYGQKEFSLRPIRLDVRVFTVRKFKPASSSYWPKDRFVWELACQSASTPDPDHNPVIVIVADDPTKDFGEPDSVRKEGGVDILEYLKSPRRMEIAGIFYRNLLSPEDTNKKTTVVSPIVIAWQNRYASSSGSNTMTIVLLSLLMVGVVLFIWWMLWKHAKSRKHEDLIRQQHRRESEDDFAPSDDEIAQMDPALLAAAEAYFKEHPEKRPLSTKKPVIKSRGADGDAIIEVDPELKKAAEQFNKEHGQHGNRQG